MITDVAEDVYLEDIVLASLWEMYISGLILASRNQECNPDSINWGWMIIIQQLRKWFKSFY